jgi:hypothetical protein
LISEGEPLTDAEIADEAGPDVAESDVSSAMAQFATLKMVAPHPDGGVFVVAWERRQFQSDDVTARTRKTRGMQRSRNVPGTLRERSRVVPGNGFGSVSETDAETETDPEKIQDCALAALEGVESPDQETPEPDGREARLFPQGEMPARKHVREHGYGREDRKFLDEVRTEFLRAALARRTSRELGSAWEATALNYAKRPDGGRKKLLDALAYIADVGVDVEGHNLGPGGWYNLERFCRSKQKSGEPANWPAAVLGHGWDAKTSSAPGTPAATGKAVRKRPEDMTPAEREEDWYEHPERYMSETARDTYRSLLKKAGENGGTA